MVDFGKKTSIYLIGYCFIQISVISLPYNDKNKYTMKTFTTKNHAVLTIEGNTVTMRTIFGDRYVGKLDENGKLVCKSAISLACISRAMYEMRNAQ